MAHDIQSRKWALTINNPLDSGFDHSEINSQIKLFSADYYCLCDEIASTGTPHTHIFLYSRSPIRFSTIKKRFPSAHIEKAYGSAADNRDYLRKEGKWKDSEKADTSVEGTFEEYGMLPVERAEKYPEMFALIQDIRDGMTISEIIDKYPNHAFRIRDIEVLRQTILFEKFATIRRSVYVTYLYGASGTGKTRSIFDNNDPREICRITNYRNGKGVNFDNYSGQDILVFEEFAGQIELEELLNYLDIYPLSLPARYSDKVACYTKVFLTSNLPLEQQYRCARCEKPESYRAFLRRIHRVVEYLADGSIIVHKDDSPTMIE